MPFTPRVSSRCRPSFCLAFVKQLLPRLLYVALRTTTHFLHIVQSCYFSPDHRLTLVFCRVLCSLHDHLRFVSSIACTPHRTYICITSSTLLCHSFSLPDKIGLSLSHLSVHRTTYNNSVPLSSKDKRIHVRGILF